VKIQQIIKVLLRAVDDEHVMITQLLYEYLSDSCLAEIGDDPFKYAHWLPEQEHDCERLAKSETGRCWDEVAGSKDRCGEMSAVNCWVSGMHSYFAECKGLSGDSPRHNCVVAARKEVELRPDVEEMAETCMGSMALAGGMAEDFGRMRILVGQIDRTGF
jgi:hypothetical protein